VLDVLFWAEAFSCNLDILYGGLGISKLHFFIIKRFSKNFGCIFFSSIFGHQNPGAGLDPDSLELNPDPVNLFVCGCGRTLGYFFDDHILVMALH
jgi:hypothetical protein